MTSATSDSSTSDGSASPELASPELAPLHIRTGVYDSAVSHVPARTRSGLDIALRSLTKHDAAAMQKMLEGGLINDISRPKFRTALQSQKC